MPLRRAIPMFCVTALAASMSLIASPAMAVVPAGPVAAAPADAPAPTSRHIQQKGTAAYRPTPTGTGSLGSLSTEIPRAVGPEAQSNARGSTPTDLGPNRSFASRQSAGASTQRVRPGQVQPGQAQPGQVQPDQGQVDQGPAGQAQRGQIIRNGPQLLTSFDGLNHRDTRTANGGNQFSNEPPDQALCVGGGHVVEAVNDAFRVFNGDGTGQTGVIDLNTFYGYPAAIDRSTGVSGPFLTDPTCLYDPTTKSFFLVVLTLDTNPTTGDFTGVNRLDIAVAKDPTATWTLYSVDVTDDGSSGTPVHPNCPCIGDYPHIGVDARGFYITTNEYSFFGPEYNSAQLYAFSKRALAKSDPDVIVTQFDTTGADAGRNGFTIWPAQSPSTGDYSDAASGTEFFLSSNAAEEATGTKDYVSDSIVVWSLVNTRSLDSAAPAPRLANARVPVTTYSLPPLSNQKPGSVPLADCLNSDPCATRILGTPNALKPEVESPLDSNDTRMQQVTYVNGRLSGALDTAVLVGGHEQAGIGWYIVNPKSDRDGVRATLQSQGQLGLAGNNLIYPAIGINSSNRGVMAFTLVGDGYYPSAAYAAFDGRRGAGSIFVAKAGVGPQDGFSGYKAFGDPPRPRWGDYGATAVSGQNIWMASEYIGQTCTVAQFAATPLGSCGGTRTALANWGTRLSLVRPAVSGSSNQEN